MDWTSWICFLVSLVCIPVYIAGEKPKCNVTFDIWEESVTMFWEPPPGAPTDALYQVKKAPYFDQVWDIVPECNMTNETKCDLGSFAPKSEIIIMIQLFNGNGSLFSSTRKRVRLVDMKLLSPEFTVFSTYNTVKVKIQKKPSLEEFFDYGPSYSAILYPKGQENQATTITSDDKDDGEVEFSSLSLFQTYCVRVKVEFTSNSVSNTSLPRCVYTSDISTLISLSVIGVAGVLSFFIFIVCFFLRRPGKMPAALKSAVHGWHPMNVGLIQVETVTDKGWLLSSNKMVAKSKEFPEENDLSEEDKERRESTDSGVSVSGREKLVDEHTTEEDSGCSSLTGTEDSLSSGRRSLEELPFLDGGVNSSNREGKEDSGLGMGNQDVSDNLQATDIDILSEIVIGGNGYRSQSPSTDADGETIVQCDADSDVASPANGYRSGQVTCLCSDFETCMWCKTRKLRTESDSLSHEQTSIFTSDTDDRPSYLKKFPLHTVNLSDLEDSSSQSDENCSESSLFITCPLLLQEPCDMDALPIMLGDVELTFT